MQARQQLKKALLAAENGLILKIPKVELHVHIEGTLTPEVRWKLAKRNGLQLRFGNKTKIVDSLEELEREYAEVISSAELPRFANAPKESMPATFFEAYFSGFQVLQTKEDFFDLAMDYFQRAAAMNIRYCEPFFDPQAHTNRGVSWDDLMGGLKEAQQKAASELNVSPFPWFCGYSNPYLDFFPQVQSSWIMCFLRDQSPESAMEHYNAALEYRDMIVGFGLDSNEFNRPPSLFEGVFSKARQDGFKITAHCDVGVKDTHKHIRQVASTLAGTGAERIDHGLNVADKQELVDLVLQRDIPLTICPWAYLRRETYDSIAERIQILKDAGVRINISSDSPAYMDISWITHNMMLTRKMCGLTDSDLVKIVQDSVAMSWARPEVKAAIMLEIQQFVESGGDIK